MKTDMPGTCHMVGCPGKGQHRPHGPGEGVWIGAGTDADYSSPKTEHCIGFPVVSVIGDGGLIAECSITGRVHWQRNIRGHRITPVDMADTVDMHKAECRNRGSR